MILIDPELDLSRAVDALNAVSARPSAGPAAKPGRELPAKPFRPPSTTALARNLARALAQFLTRAQAAVRLRGQVTVMLTSDAAMRDLNRRFRGKNKPTDVLSFPASSPTQNQKNGRDRIAGDVAISVETAIRQSVEQGHSLAIEIKVLMLHGLLHLAGHDHETDGGEMLRRERSLRARLGLPLGLIERSASSKRKATADPSTRSLRELAQDDRSKERREKMSGATYPIHSQKTRMGGARRDRQGGARGRKATTGPSTRSLRELAHDDRSKERRKKMSGTASPTLSQKTRKDGATKPMRPRTTRRRKP